MRDALTTLGGIPVVQSDALPFGVAILVDEVMGRRVLAIGRSQTPIYDQLRAEYERGRNRG